MLCHLYTTCIFIICLQGGQVGLRCFNDLLATKDFHGSPWCNYSLSMNYFIFFIHTATALIKNTGFKGIV